MSDRSAPLLDFIASAQARDEAIAIVASNNREWMSLALLQLEQFAKGKHEWSNLEYGFTGEDVRHMLIPHVGRPSKPEGWGSLVMHALRRKIIVDTNTRRPMKDVKSHARKTPVYQFAGR